MKWVFFEKITKVDYRFQNHIFEFSAIYLKKIRFSHEIDDVAPFFDSKLDEKHDPTIFRIQKQNKIKSIFCPAKKTGKNRKNRISGERLDLEN